MPKTTKGNERTNLPVRTRTAILTEAGYRCAVPTCRQILALDIHHIWEVADGGGDDPSNLIALCPNCHALYHRGTIAPDAIYAYKAMLVAITGAFDLEAIDRLMFLEMHPKDYLVVSGDGLLQFARLIAAKLATCGGKNHNWTSANYTVNISDKGRMLIEAWKQGDRTKIEAMLSRDGRGGVASS